MAQIEQGMYFIMASVFGVSNVCKGNVLNIGLGPGVSARAFAWSPFVTKMTSVEINPATVTTYRGLYPANEAIESGQTVFVSNPSGGRHTIRTGDAATLPANQFSFPYDFVYIDILEAYDSIIYNKLKDIAARLALNGVLTAGGAGKLCIQWQSDVQIERQARNWMEDNGWIAEVIRPALAYNGWGRAAEMLVYHR